MEFDSSFDESLVIEKLLKINKKLHSYVNYSRIIQSISLIENDNTNDVYEDVLAKRKNNIASIYNKFLIEFMDFKFKFDLENKYKIIDIVIDVVECFNIFNRYFFEKGFFDIFIDYFDYSKNEIKTIMVNAAVKARSLLSKEVFDFNKEMIEIDAFINQSNS